MLQVYPEVKLYDLDDNDCIKSIESQIKAGNPFGLRFYFFDDILLAHVRQIIDILLARYNQEQFEPLLYGGLKEIIINGAKANLKRVVYDVNHLNLSDHSHVEQGINLLKKELKLKTPQQLSELLQQNDLYLILYLFPGEEGLRIEVLNNSGLSEIEESIIRKKFRDAEKHDDLLAFMESQSEVFEGAGLGIFMFVLMLKKMGIHPGYFRIGNNALGHTISRIEIPFNEKFKSIRKSEENNLAE